MAAAYVPLPAVVVPQSDSLTQFTKPLSEEELAALLLKWDPDTRRAARYAANKFQLDESFAEDFAQEARVKLLKCLRQNPTAPVHYIRRLIANAVQDGVSSTRSMSDNLAINEGTQECSSAVQEAEKSLDPFTIVLVNEFVNTLPTRLRTIYELLYVEGYSQQEAALKLNVAQPRIAQLHQEILERGRYQFERFGSAASGRLQ